MTRVGLRFADVNFFTILEYNTELYLSDCFHFSTFPLLKKVEQNPLRGVNEAFATVWSKSFVLFFDKLIWHHLSKGG